MSKKTNARVIDVQTGQTLMSCSIEDSNRAYAYAAEMESLGLDVKVLIPTLSETLGTTLGLSNTQMAEYEKSLDDEMEHHDGSCCFENSDPEKKIN